MKEKWIVNCKQRGDWISIPSGGYQPKGFLWDYVPPIIFLGADFFYLNIRKKIFNSRIIIFFKETNPQGKPPDPGNVLLVRKSVFLVEYN